MTRENRLQALERRTGQADKRVIVCWHTDQEIEAGMCDCGSDADLIIHVVYTDDWRGANGNQSKN